MDTKEKQGSMRSPLARARGLGAAGHGSGHWMAQRFTAIANIPLTLWLVYSIITLKGASHEVFVAWLGQPVNAVLMILFLLSVFYHAALGLQVVIEDYVHCSCAKITALIGIKFALLALAMASILSILKVAL
ncbi:MAG: succinate dehydrogenase, hydrophobic membrane anchor protein [Alphaproteobacteria bacterium]|nr:succinate dehydrogenase, hydrophobic membrane anchor protein [Alphaproteobacteria bacterium]